MKERTVDDVFREQRAELEAGLILVFYQGWLDLKAIWEQSGVLVHYDYPCERCRRFHWNNSGIGKRHAKYQEAMP